MAVSESQTGSTTTDGTKQQLGSTINTAGNYMLRLNTDNLANGDIVEISVELKARVADSGVCSPYIAVLGQDQGARNGIETPWLSIPTNGALAFYIYRKAGTDRAYTWAILTQ